MSNYQLTPVQLSTDSVASLIQELWACRDTLRSIVIVTKNLDGHLSTAYGGNPRSPDAYQAVGLLEFGKVSIMNGIFGETTEYSGSEIFDAIADHLGEDDA